MKVGKTFNSCKISGFVRSGEVHVLMYSSSISWDPYVAAGRELNISSKSCCGVLRLEESSIVSETEADSGIEIDRGEGEYEREMEGVSRNGSLGALGLFARGDSSAAKFLRAGIGGFERRGCD